MVLLVFLLLGLVAGFVAGGRISGAVPLPRGLWLCILAFLVQGGAAMLPQAFLAGVAPVSVWQMGVAVARYGLLFAFVAWNIRTRPAQAWPWIFGAGTAANAAVILANGGAMPVAGRLLPQISPAVAARLAAGEIFAYTLETPATRLPFLGDIIRIGGGATLGFASIGDFFIGAGAGLLVFCLLRAGAPAQKVQEDAP